MLTSRTLHNWTVLQLSGGYLLSALAKWYVEPVAHSSGINGGDFTAEAAKRCNCSNYCD